MVWQSLIRTWLQQQVRQSAYQAVDAARGRAEQAASQPARQCDVGLVFALGIESGGLVDLLSEQLTTSGPGFIVRQGMLQARSVVLVEAGVGTTAAARGTQALLAGHRPMWVVSAGFAGGLDPRVRRGDIIMADSIAGGDGRRLAIDLKLPAEAMATPGLHVGRLVTADAVLFRPGDKRTLGEQQQALAVDMESWAVGEVCRQAKTRFLAIRVISDAVDDELPADVERLARQNTPAARLGAAAGAIFRRPSSVKDMLKLKEEALIGSDRLARFLAGIVVQLAPAHEPDSESIS